MLRRIWMSLAKNEEEEEEEEKFPELIETAITFLSFQESNH